MNRRIRYLIILLGIPVLISAQYIAEVLEYMPAPGQYINTSWGDLEAASSLVSSTNGHLSLGAFGGYVVFSFEEAVENHPDNPYGVDFSIFGNSSATWSEPGVVWVMKDANANGFPDDTWYELAGSDHWFSTSVKNYEVTYFNPGDSVSDITWTDMQGKSGKLALNTFHKQPWFPQAAFFDGYRKESLTFKGTLIIPAMDSSNASMEMSYTRAFGYADNQSRGDGLYIDPDDPYNAEIDHAGGDSFDISWAVDSNDNYIELDEIHFVKVQSACLDQSQTLGELSPEILYAADIPPASGTSSSFQKQIVMKDIPKNIFGEAHSVEAHVFYKGRIVKDEEIVWSCSNPHAYFSDSDTLYTPEAGELSISATLSSDATIFVSQTTTVNPALEASYRKTKALKIYPNPAEEFILFNSPFESCSFRIFDLSGKLCMAGDIGAFSENLNITKLERGVYLLELNGGEKHMSPDRHVITAKFIKK